MLYARFPQSLRNVEDLLLERGIDVSHETVRFWWNRFGPRDQDARCSDPIPRLGTTYFIVHAVYLPRRRIEISAL